MSKVLRNRVREARQGKGWTQRELARRTGLSRQTLSAIEAGRLPRHEVTERLCSVLEVDLGSLFWTETVADVVEAVA